MYFPVLKKAIQSLEEKAFYDISILFLQQLGYKDLSIVDGTGDGGRDVTCSRSDLRIQLSVRRDWENKINQESATALAAGKRHLIYVTNRSILPDEQDSFRSQKFKLRGEVDLTICDLNRIATTLAQPNVIRNAYTTLGMDIPTKLNASPKDIAISTILLFSPEARELRDEVIEANIRAVIFNNVKISESKIIEEISRIIPGINISRIARSAIARLRGAGHILGASSEIHLSDSDKMTMEAAQVEISIARAQDIQRISEASGLDDLQSGKLLDLALDLLVKNQDLNGYGPAEQSIANFIANNKLASKKDKLYEVLSGASLARMRQYGHTIEQIFSADSFDIYRALGQRTDISVILDASVAMPVLFGLSFGAARSRYGVAAIALKEACTAHQIRMVVPRAYLNEMASHGLRALGQIDIYAALPPEARSALRASENAYLSHYTHIAATEKEAGRDLTLREFLGYFGISPGRNIHSVENKLESLLENFSINVVPDVRYDKKIYDIISKEKPHDFPILIHHDASVVTLLRDDTDKGFILATWDNVLINIVEGLARVYADRPVRVIDFLSMAGRQAMNANQSFDLFSSLLYIDERAAAKLAKKIEQIKNTDQAHRLDKFISEARSHKGKDWEISPDHLAQFIDEALDDEMDPQNAGH